MYCHKWNVIGLIAVLTLFGGTGRAAGAKGAPVEDRTLPAGAGMGEIILNWVDVAHAEISKRILSTAHRLDTFFGDERIAEERQNTQIKVSTVVTLDENRQTDVSFPITTNLALPHLEKRVQIVVDSLLKKNPDAFVSAQDAAKGNNVKVSLRYLLLKKVREWVSLDTGVRVSGSRLSLSSLEPFATLRIRGTTDFDPWALRLTHFVNWFKTEGVSAVSRFDLERRIGSQMFFRMTGNALWVESEPGVQLIQTFFLRRQFSDKRAIGLELSAEGQTRAPAAVNAYAATLTYRRQLYKEWVFLTVAPGVQFLRTDGFKRAPVFLFNCEVQFGRSSE